MKSLRCMLSVVLMSLSTMTMAFAQTEAPKSQTETKKPQSDAQKTFDALKTLEGTWEGPVSGVPSATDVEGKLARVSLRATSMGNALMHEMRVGERADDPITMLYLEGDRLMLTHYCDAGNRPRMTAKWSPDGKTVEFEFLDITGNTKYGHMHGVKFTFIDADHHTEDWTFDMGKAMAHPHFDLRRTSPATGTSKASK